MEPSNSIDAFLKSPVGRYVAGSSFLVWAHSPTLIGNIHFGRPGEADFAHQRKMFDLPLHPDLEPPFDVVMDGSGLEDVNVATYDLLVWYTSHKLPQYVDRVRRMAVVQPAHYVGVTVAGLFHEIVMPRFSARLFRTPEEAFDWLDRPDASAARDELDRAFRALDEEGQLVAKLRARLRDALGAGSTHVGEVARSLGVSERTLQRELLRAGTSFRAELAEARMERAETLLCSSDLKVETIAHRVGCASGAHFSAMFQRARGVTPRAFRTQRGMAESRK